jgi:hypothetical protein
VLTGRTWWTLSLLLTLHTTHCAAAGAGLAASMAILTRPNLLPLAAVLGCYYLCQVASATPPDRRPVIQRLGIFCLAVLPGCLAVAALNTYLYGSALSSGYAPLRELYQWSRASSLTHRWARSIGHRPCRPPPAA